MRQIFAIVALSCAACGSDGDSGKDPSGPSDAELTWFRDIEPIVQEHCNVCHAPGGIANQVLGPDPALASLMADRVESGEMPPWPPTRVGPPLVGERLLDQTSIDKISAWAADGAPEGDPVDHRSIEPRPTFELTDPDVSLLLPVDYQPNTGLEDDVRCFVMDLPFSGNTFVSATRWVVDQKSAVHHIGAAVAAPDQAAAARKIDDSELDADGVNRPGYACQGGLRVNLSAGFGAGGPGTDGVEYPTGTGVFVPAGASVIITMHYWTPGVTGTDRSGIELWQAKEPVRPLVPVNAFAPTELPCPSGITTEPGDRCSREFAIASVDGFEPKITRAISDYYLSFCDKTLADLHGDLSFSDPAAKSFFVDTTCDHTIPYDGTVHLVTTHQHTRGHTSRLSLERASAWQPLLDVDWDWHWEGTYVLRAGEPVKKGQKLRLDCEFDNGTLSQPTDDQGQVLAPRYVVPGEGRYDEMCGGNVWIARDPFEGKSYASLCEEARAIFDTSCPELAPYSGTVFGGACDGQIEQRSVLLLITPPDLVHHFWCEPAPEGPGATTGPTCIQTAQCAGACAFGACLESCRTAASPLGRYRFDRLYECAQPWCSDVPLDQWGPCAAVACKSEAQACSAP